MASPNAHPFAVIPEDHCAAIGLVAITWADFELAVDRCIWVLLKVDQQIGACVTAQMNSMFNRMNAMTSLAQERGASDPLRKKLSVLAGKLGSLSEERNRVVHDARFWMVERKKIGRFQATAKANLKFDVQTETISSLYEIAQRMEAHKQEFMKIWAELAAELGKLPPKPGQRPRKLVFPDLELLAPTTSQE